MSPAEFQFFSELLRDRSGISLSKGKEYLIDARMAPIVEHDKLGSFSGLIEKLRSGGDEALVARVVEAMTTNETSFFRDLHPFEVLKSHVIPTLLEKHESDRKLQIWSAASSTGQEPYSIAMVLLDNFPELANWTIGIVATDLSEDVVEHARTGCYTQLEVNRGLPALLLAKYFKRKGSSWEMIKTLRDMVEFRTLNLLEPLSGLPPADIVFIRNVLIYFDQDLKGDILGRVRGVMNPGSYLFLGGAESVLNVDTSFERVDPPRAGCYQLKEK